MDTKFGANVSNRILLNAAKFQGYSLYRFWVIKGRPTGEVKYPPPPTQINKASCIDLFWLINREVWNTLVESKQVCVIFTRWQSLLWRHFLRNFSWERSIIETVNILKVIDSELMYGKNITSKLNSKQRNYSVSLLRKSKSDYFGNLNDKSINDNKTFWKTIKPFLSDKVTTNKMKKLFWVTIILPKLMCCGK